MLALIRGLLSPFQVKKWLGGFIKMPSAYFPSSLMKEVGSLILPSIKSAPHLTEMPKVYE